MNTRSFSREDFIAMCDSKIRLVRAEYELSQERMAHIIGISKKTLVEIEKSRSSLGWCGSVTMCAVFPESGVISSTFGVPAAEIIARLVSGDIGDGKVSVQSGPWWQTVRRNKNYIIEQNVISQHYRIMTAAGTIIASSFEMDDLTEIFETSISNK